MVTWFLGSVTVFGRPVAPLPLGIARVGHTVRTDLAVDTPVGVALPRGAIAVGVNERVERAAGFSKLALKMLTTCLSP